MKLAPSLSSFARTLVDLMVRREVLHAPVAKVVEEAWQARAVDEDPATNGKRTGMALCVPTTDVSFMLVVICAKTNAAQR